MKEQIRNNTAILKLRCKKFCDDTLVILINATKQFWYALQNPKWRNKY